MYKKFSFGMIEIITGPMFSGKTEELIRRIKILKYSDIKTLIIKHSLDIRYSESELNSRCGTSFITYKAKDVDTIKNLFNSSYEAVVIDEVQFFSEELVEYVDWLANNGIIVILSGLDQNFKREPFGIMPKLLAMAEKVTKLRAVCVVCKNPASCTYRKIKDESEILIGSENEYETRCRHCHLLSEGDQIEVKQNKE